MKTLNIAAFGALVSWIGTKAGGTFMNKQDCDDLSFYVKDCIEVPEVPSASIVGIKAMLMAIKNGKRIEAIKEHRALTGYGLKESKDAIEAAWPGPSEREFALSKFLNNISHALNNDAPFDSEMWKREADKLLS